MFEQIKVNPTYFLGTPMVYIDIGNDMGFTTLTIEEAEELRDKLSETILLLQLQNKE